MPREERASPVSATYPKPEKPAPAPRRRIEPKCGGTGAICGHSRHRHDPATGACRGEDEHFTSTYQRVMCQCKRYTPARSSVLRSPVARKKAPADPKCARCETAKSIHGGGWCEFLPKVKTVVSVPRKSAPARTKRPRKQRKTGRAKLMRLADKLAGQICRARGKCEDCGAGPEAVLQWAHLFSRRYHAVRWNLLNCACLCRGCHFKHGLRPLEFDEWMRALLGQPTYDELRRIALKNERVDMEATVAYLRVELEKVSA